MPRSDRKLILYRLNKNIEEQDDHIRRLEEIGGMLADLEHKYPGRYVHIIAALSALQDGHKMVQQLYNVFIDEMRI